MKKFSLTAMARTQMQLAAKASSGRSANTVFGGHEHTLRQTVIGLAAGTELNEHSNPGEATVLVLSGRIVLASDAEHWEGRTGDLLVLPSGRSQISALEESGVLLSVAKIDRKTRGRPPHRSPRPLGRLLPELLPCPRTRRAGCRVPGLEGNLAEAVGSIRRPGSPVRPSTHSPHRSSDSPVL